METRLAQKFAYHFSIPWCKTVFGSFGRTANIIAWSWNHKWFRQFLPPLLYASETCSSFHLSNTGFIIILEKNVLKKLHFPIVVKSPLIHKFLYNKDISWTACAKLPAIIFCNFIKALTEWRHSRFIILQTIKQFSKRHIIPSSKSVLIRNMLSPLFSLLSHFGSWRILRPKAYCSPSFPWFVYVIDSN